MFDDTGYVPNVWSWTLNDLTYPHYFQSSFCWLLELVASPCPTLLGLCRLVLVNPIQKWMDRIFTSQRIPADSLTGFLECERQRCRAWTNTTVADLYRVRICFRIYICTIIYVYIYVYICTLMRSWSWSWSWSWCWWWVWSCCWCSCFFCWFILMVHHDFPCETGRVC